MKCFLLWAGCVDGIVGQQATQPAVERVELPAAVEAFERAEIHARVSGYMVEVLADLGDKVKAGQVLARIERPELLAELAAGQAATLEQSSEVERAKRSAQQAEAALVHVRACLERSRVVLDLQKATIHRLRELHEARAVTDQAMDDAAAALATAKVEFDIATAAVARAEADVGAAGAGVTVAIAGVAVAESRVRCIEAEVALLVLRAPFDGVVAARRCSRGDLAPLAPKAGDSGLFTLLQTDPVRIQVDVPEPMVGRIAQNTPVTVIPAGARPAVAARVTRTAGSLDPRTRTLRVEIELGNAGAEWLCGTFVRVQFELAPLPRKDK